MSKIERHEDGGWILWEEYGIRALDAIGDCVDVNHADTLAEAIEFSRHLVDRGALAVAVEHEVCVAPTRDKVRMWKREGWCDDYDILRTVVHKVGDAAALAAWESIIAGDFSTITQQEV
jgi:hypothetical protein